MTTVLHLISGLGLGGAERMLVETAIGLKHRGLAQHVVSLRGRGQYADDLESAGVPVSAFDIVSAPQALSALWRLRQVVHRIQPDIIQGWMYHGDLAATAAHLVAQGRSRRRLCWNIRASNVEDARYTKLIRACGWFSRWPDVIVANSEAGEKFHTAHGYRPRRIIVIPNGIDTDKFCPNPIARSTLRAELGLGDKVVAVHVARVDPMKDHATFLAAMASLPDILGLFVGGGTETLVCPPNVHALGIRRDVERIYAAADLVVSSSAFGEGFSNALAEGMSAGLVPVATDVGDAGRIIGLTGHVVAPRNPTALAAAIKAEATLSPDQRRDRGLQARARIVGSFARARAIEAYARLYQEIYRGNGTVTGHSAAILYR
jgi:glycosyltransferase involved in cell wall biosynthesis